MAALRPVATLLPPHLAAYEPYQESIDEPLFEELQLSGVQEWPLFDKMPWRFDTCKVEQCNLVGSNAPTMHLWDSILVRSDLSANKLFDSGWLRSELLGCRCTGLQLGESNLKDVSFQNCKLNMVSFRKCNLERVVFENCILDDADFNGAKLTDVTFIRCEMNKTDFSGVTCTRVDLTQTTIDSIRGVTSLHGVRILPEQTISLAPLLCADLGIQIV